jgi:hypothetical protein
MINLIKLAICSLFFCFFYKKDTPVSFENRKIKIDIFQDTSNINIFVKNKQKKDIYLQRPKTNITLNDGEKDIFDLTSELGCYNPHLLIPLYRIKPDSTFNLTVKGSKYFIYECIPLAEKTVFKYIEDSEQKRQDTLNVSLGLLLAIQRNQKKYHLSNFK